jgi:hypothetical protein
MRHALLPLLVVLPLAALAGCAELRTPPPAPPPADLAGGNQPGRLADPVRAAIVASAAAFADAGLSLAEKPDAVAQAAAQLEYLSVALPRSEAYAAMPPGTVMSLGLAREELRAALGVNDAADPQQVMRALLAAARALRANQPEQAAAALPAGLFRPGGSASIRRFAEPGPLPQAAAATNLAQQELAKMDANRLWLQGRNQDLIGMEIGNTSSGTAPGMSGF